MFCIIRGINLDNYKQTSVILFSIIICFFLNSCAMKMQRGKIQYGNDGEIKSGEGVALCKPPDKRYSSEIHAALKTELIGLKNTSDIELEAALERKIVKLTDYSQKGLDLDLILFRICEISINRGFTNKQSSKLIENVIEAWTQAEYKNRKKTKNISKWKIRVYHFDNFSFEASQQRLGERFSGLILNNLLNMSLNAKRNMSLNAKRDMTQVIPMRSSTPVKIMKEYEELAPYISINGFIEDKDKDTFIVHVRVSKIYSTQEIETFLTKEYTITCDYVEMRKKSMLVTDDIYNSIPRIESED